MFDFPNAPVLNQQILEPNGAVLRWDGVKWVNIAGQVNTITVTPAYNSVGRNLLHNSMFTVQQRGPGPFTAQGYTVDRWAVYISLPGDTFSVLAYNLSDSHRTAIGDEAARVGLINTFTGAAGAFNCVYILQPIENLARLAGKTVTVSFWATGNTALKLGVSIDQNFGSGGSPSAYAEGVGQSVTLSTTPTRYTLTFAVPSTTGKTLGTANDHATVLLFWYSSSSTYATRAGNIGVQSGVVWLWGVQLEIGTAATPLDKPEPTDDLRNCQRFFISAAFQISGYSGFAASPALSGVTFPSMRAVPSIALSNIGYASCSALSVSYANTTQWVPLLTTPANGWFAVNGTYSASAEL